MLGALLHQALDPDARAQLTAHLDDCVACQRTMIAAVRGGVAPQHTTGAELEATVPGHAGAAMPFGGRLGRYELRALLGIGGMGSVYEAHDVELDRAVALKILRPEMGKVSGLADRLLRESRLMAKLSHPSVITVYDVGSANDAVFIAMELIRGSTLGAWLASSRPGWRAIVTAFERAGRGLAAAHAAGIVHRDFKPENVLVAHDADKVVVTDFGIAREAAQTGPVEPGAAAAISVLDLGRTSFERTPGASLTAAGAVIGTPAYMAPEQIAGREVDRRSDIFAFSVALWEALFRTRPFPGQTLAEIAEAMRHSPVRPPTGAMRVPRRLVRALRKGLAIEPRDRWGDMPALLAELAAIRSARKRISLAAGAAGLVGLGLAAALVTARPAAMLDRCAQQRAALDQAYNPMLEAKVISGLAHERAIADAVVGNLRATADAWRATQQATCHADRDVVQDAATTACLDARRLELAGSVDDLIANGPAGAGYAIKLSKLAGEPAACATPAPGLLFVRVPADRELRRKVTALRARLEEASEARARADFKQALAAAEPVVAAAATLWAPLHAEALLALGAIQRTGTDDPKRGIETLLAAAALADRVHHDEVVAASWIQLVEAMTFDQGDAPHALEYADRAEAAANRIGRPRDLVIVLDYAKGEALMAAHRSSEAEIALREAATLAETSSPWFASIAREALGTLYSDQGRHRDAVAMYRLSNEHDPAPQPPSYYLIAQNLAWLGEVEEAETLARRAVELADRTLPETQLQRPAAHLKLAQVLQDRGHDQEAIREASQAVAMFAAAKGTRSERYAEALCYQADILTYMGRQAEAEPLLARACEILAFVFGEGDPYVASCEVSHGEALVALHRAAAALPRLERAVPVLASEHGESNWRFADAVRTRGAAYAAAGQHRAAIADFERAIAILGRAEVEPGYLATARWELGKELWADEPQRARAELAAALTLFDHANGRWSWQRAEAVAWLAHHERRGRRRGPRVRRRSRRPAPH
jgi:tetratricopeptide (TPR) repeat protein